MTPARLIVAGVRSKRARGRLGGGGDPEIGAGLALHRNGLRYSLDARFASATIGGMRSGCST